MRDLSLLTYALYLVHLPMLYLVGKFVPDPSPLVLRAALRTVCHCHHRPCRFGLPLVGKAFHAASRPIRPMAGNAIMVALTPIASWETAS